MNGDKTTRSVVVGYKIDVTSVIDRQWWWRSLALQQQQLTRSPRKSHAGNVIDLRNYLK